LRAEIGGHVGSEDRLQAIVEPHIIPRTGWAYHDPRTDSLTTLTLRRNNHFGAPKGSSHCGTIAFRRNNLIAMGDHPLALQRSWGVA
jgi:hypothetical protein